MRILLLVVTLPILILAILVALTPDAERVSVDYFVRERGTGISLPDLGYEWELEEDGGILRRHSGTRLVVARYAPARTGSPTHEVEWRIRRRAGLLVAPRIGGKELFDFHRGATREETMRMPIGARRPIPGTG